MSGFTFSHKSFPQSPQCVYLWVWPWIWLNVTWPKAKNAMAWPAFLSWTSAFKGRACHQLCGPRRRAVAGRSYVVALETCISKHRFSWSSAKTQTREQTQPAMKWPGQISSRDRAVKMYEENAFSLWCFITENILLILYTFTRNNDHSSHLLKSGSSAHSGSP